MVTRYTWHVVGGEHGLNIFSSLAITFWDLWCFEDLEEKDDWLTETINDKGVCRTAPATPGLLKSNTLISGLWLV